MVTSRERLHKCVGPQFALILACGVAAVLSACASVPGETLASMGTRRDVSRRVLEQASAAAPACRSRRIADTEVVEVYPDGKVALERWTVEQCGSRAYFRVVFPAAGKATPVQVHPE